MKEKSIRHAVLSLREEKTRETCAHSVDISSHPHNPGVSLQPPESKTLSQFWKSSQKRPHVLGQKDGHAVRCVGFINEVLKCYLFDQVWRRRQCFTRCVAWGVFAIALTMFYFSRCKCQRNFSGQQVVVSSRALYYNSA